MATSKIEGAADRNRTTRKPELAEPAGNRLAWAAIRKPAEVNCPAALARAGFPRAATPEEGRSAGAVTEPRSPGEPDRSPQCDPPEQVTGAQALTGATSGR